MIFIPPSLFIFGVAPGGAVVEDVERSSCREESTLDGTAGDSQEL